jgi:sodium pump decarboxylase gamma subunit
MNIELLKDGCLLMLIGMGFVFVFIQLMVWFMQLNAKIIEIINKKFPEVTEENKYPIKKATKNDDEIALAIACAFARQKS